MTIRPLKILVVSQMYPGDDAPDLGIFVQNHVNELERRGHTVSVEAITRRGGGPLKHLSLMWRAIVAILRSRPDAVYAHFLAPAGVAAAIGCAIYRRPRLVVVAHGRDVRNASENAVVNAATRFVVNQADSIVAVSSYLGQKLVQVAPSVQTKLSIIDMGIDTRKRFTPRRKAKTKGKAKSSKQPTEQGIKFVAVGTLDERKNVLRLAEAVGRIDSAKITFVGDGPLRAELEGLDHVAVTGLVDQKKVVRNIRDADALCLVSTVEPFGQVLIEAMACAKSVVATRVGGPPEFVPPECGVLVDPFDVDDIEAGLREVLEFPRPNIEAREHAKQHDVIRKVDAFEALLLSDLHG